MNFDLEKIEKDKGGPGFKFFLSRFGLELLVLNVETDMPGAIKKDDCPDEAYLYQWIDDFKGTS